VVAARKFRHNAAIGAVHINLSMESICKQALRVGDERCAGFIAGGFNAENNHGYSIRKSPRNCPPQYPTTSRRIEISSFGSIRKRLICRPAV